MNKQIEELTITLTEAKHEHDAAWTKYFHFGGELLGVERPKGENAFTAEYLYNAGYRKQSVGKWKPILAVCNRGMCSNCNEIGAVRWNFCPNCGAKMKGDNNDT